MVYNFYNKQIYAELPCNKSDYFEKLSVNKYKEKLVDRIYSNHKIITFDIETYVDGKTGTLVPYAVGSYTGGEGNYIRHEEELKMYYLLDFEGVDVQSKVQKMLFQALKDILVVKNRGYIVYTHNLGGYDGFLLIKYLKDVKNLKIKPLFRSNTIYAIDFSFPVDCIDED
jgi:hypothetical protein